MKKRDQQGSAPKRERPGKADIGVDMLVKSDVLNFFVNEWREGAECTSSGKSLSIIRKAEAKNA